MRAPCELSDLSLTLPGLETLVKTRLQALEGLPSILDVVGARKARTQNFFIVGQKLAVLEVKIVLSEIVPHRIQVFIGELSIALVHEKKAGCDLSAPQAWYRVGKILFVDGTRKIGQQRPSKEHARVCCAGTTSRRASHAAT